MYASTCSTSWQPFLVSVSPAVSALLSATALWVASRARSTSKVAQQTSRVALGLSPGVSPTSSVSLSPDIVEVLRRRSSTTSGPDDTSTSRGD
jgi:hypothetical protein